MIALLFLPKCRRKNPEEREGGSVLALSKASVIELTFNYLMKQECAKRAHSIK